MDTNMKPGVITLPKRSVPLTPEQVAQLSPAKKALLIAAASDKPIIIRH